MKKLLLMLVSLFLTLFTFGKGDAYTANMSWVRMTFSRMRIVHALVFIPIPSPEINYTSLAE